MRTRRHIPLSFRVFNDVMNWLRITVTAVKFNSHDSLMRLWYRNRGSELRILLQTTEHKHGSEDTETYRFRSRDSVTPAALTSFWSSGQLTPGSQCTDFLCQVAVHRCCLRFLFLPWDATILLAKLEFQHLLTALLCGKQDPIYVLPRRNAVRLAWDTRKRGTREGEPKTSSWKKMQIFLREQNFPCTQKELEWRHQQCVSCNFCFGGFPERGSNPAHAVRALNPHHYTTREAPCTI